MTSIINIIIIIINNDKWDTSSFGIKNKRVIAPKKSPIEYEKNFHVQWTPGKRNFIKRLIFVGIKQINLNRVKISPVTV
jgi:hypothetical protein